MSKFHDFSRYFLYFYGYRLNNNGIDDISVLGCIQWLVDVQIFIYNIVQQILVKGAEKYIHVFKRKFEYI